MIIRAKRSLKEALPHIVRESLPPAHYITQALPQGFRALRGRFRTVARNHTLSPGAKPLFGVKLLLSGSWASASQTLYAIRGNKFVKAGKDKRRGTVGPSIIWWRNRLGKLPWTLNDSENHSNQLVKDYIDELRDVLRINRHQQKRQRQRSPVVSVLSGATGCGI